MCACIPALNSKPHAERRAEGLGPREPQSGTAPWTLSPHTGLPLGCPPAHPAMPSRESIRQSRRQTLRAAERSGQTPHPAVTGQGLLRTEVLHSTQVEGWWSKGPTCMCSGERGAESQRRPQMPRGRGSTHTISTPGCWQPSVHGWAPHFLAGLGSHVGQLSTWISRGLTIGKTGHPPTHPKAIASLVRTH